MKRRVILVIVGCFACAVLIALTTISCTGRYRYDDFDPEKEGIVDVIVNARTSIMSNRKESETRYYSLATGERIRLTEAFEPDTVSTYTVPLGCFESYVDRDKNKVLNRLDHIALEDSNRNQVSVSETETKVFYKIAELEHDLMDIRFIEISEQIFVYLELNVNLWTPCCLYWYDRDVDALVLLHEWDAEEVVGLRLRNITLAEQD